MPRIRYWQFTSILLIGLSVALGLAVTKADWLAAQDAAISANLHGLDTGWAHSIMSLISAIFSPIGGIAILALAALGLALRRRLVDALLVVTVIGSGWLSTLVLKHLIDRPRPPVATADGGGYPSGHVALVTAVVFAVFFLARNVDWRDTVATVGPMLIVLVAFSRVILGAHYLTDTIGAVLLASGAVIGISGCWHIGAGVLAHRAARETPPALEPTSYPQS